MGTCRLALPICSAQWIDATVARSLFRASWSLFRTVRGQVVAYGEKIYCIRQHIRWVAYSFVAFVCCTMCSVILLLQSVFCCDSVSSALDWTCRDSGCFCIWVTGFISHHVVNRQSVQWIGVDGTLPCHLPKNMTYWHTLTQLAHWVYNLFGLLVLWVSEI